MPTEYTKVSFATFEEDESQAQNGFYGFESPIDDEALNGRLWVGYNFERDSARMYIDLADGNTIKRLPFYPNYSYALLDPITEEAIQRGDDTQFIYFADGMPNASTATVGGPSGPEGSENNYYTPVYLKEGTITACSGTTVTSLAQSFSGTKTFNDDLIVSGTATLESSLSVTGTTALGGVLGVSGVTTLANKLVFSGTTNSTSQIHFNRTNNPSYFTCGTGGYFAFCANGKSAGVDNADFIIKANSIYPGTTELVSLGTSSKKWTNVYATTFTGDLAGNASSANRLNLSKDVGTTALPVYFSGGIPVECVGEDIFSGFSRSARNGTTNTLSATIAGKTRTFTLGAATATYAGLVTNGAQTFAGNKTFNNNVTIEGTTTFKGIIKIDADSYGTELPATGVDGQVFFLLLD